MATGNGETECLIFSSDYDCAAKHLNGYNVSIIAGYPFISAHAAYVHIHDIKEIAGLASVRAITSQSKVYTLEKNFCQSVVARSKATTQSQGQNTLHRIASSAEHPSNDDVSYDIPIEQIEDTIDCREEHLYSGVCEAHTAGNFGDGVTIAVIDTGIIPHLDFVMPTDRIAAFVDFVDGVDFAIDNFGHGTAVASIASGNGLVSGRKFVGVAPKSRVIALRAIGDKGEGGAFKILEAMQWIIDHKETYNIRIVCMSFGAKPQEIDPLVIGAEALWDAGITVVASSGNTGPKSGTVMSPACSRKIISVGGVGRTDFGFYVPAFSSRGVVGVDGTTKPDIAAPAVEVMSCSIGENFYAPHSGTSMAAPYVAGICALLLEQEPRFTPDKLKEILMENAQRLPFEPSACGKGLVQV